MIELVIEKWGSLDGSAHYLWSVWRDGNRVEMSGRIASAEAAESQGRTWCERVLRQAPDRITRL
jgi:hypothetical protein